MVDSQYDTIKETRDEYFANRLSYIFGLKTRQQLEKFKKNLETEDNK